MDQPTTRPGRRETSNTASAVNNTHAAHTVKPTGTAMSQGLYSPSPIVRRARPIRGENVRGRMSGGHAMPNPRPWMATFYIYCLIYCAEEARRGWETMVWCCRSGDVDGVWMYSSGRRSRCEMCCLQYPIYNTCLCHFIQSYYDNCQAPACPLPNEIYIIIAWTMCTISIYVQ